MLFIVFGTKKTKQACAIMIDYMELYNLNYMKNIVVSKIIVTFICELLSYNVVHCIQDKETKQACTIIIDYMEWFNLKDMKRNVVSIIIVTITCELLMDCVVICNGTKRLNEHVQQHLVTI
jgi:hypothetical protein